MSKINISYEAALANHPKEVAELQKEAAKKLKKSKAKNKGSSIDELTWEYSVCTRITNSGTIYNVLFKEKSHKNYSLEEKIQDQISKTEVGLSATMNGAWASCSISGVPEVVQESIRDSITKQHEEQMKFDNMSEEDKQQELQDILKVLRKSKGFIEIG